MSGASDISRLFEMAGGSPAHYQEVEGTEQSRGSRGRWSMPAENRADDLFVWPEDDSQESALNAAQAEASSANTDTRSDPVQRPMPVGLSVREPVFVPTAEPMPTSSVVRSFSEPVVDMPAPPPLSSVFARLLKQGEPHGDPT